VWRLYRFASDACQQPWSADDHTASSGLGHGL
jgi:hypothetical protein